jgi:NADH-quinone oxidoreductase subunit E
LADQQDNTVYEFSPAEIAEIQKHVAKYPLQRSAVMPALWMAQTKYGWLSKGAIELVANTLGLPFAHVFGVASFYTMYFKQAMPKHVFDICTCFTCGETGGEEVYQHCKKYLKCDAKGYSADGQFFVRHAECLGACDTAPVAQVTNGHYVHNLNKEKIERLVEDMRSGKMPEYVQIAQPK